MIGQGYFWSDLKKRVDQKIKDRTAKLAEGSALSFEDYRSQVQYIAALNWVLEQAREILEGRRKETVFDEED